MAWEVQFVALVPYILAILFASGVAIQALRSFLVKGRIWMALNLFTLAFWVTVYLIEVLSADDAIKIFMMQTHVVTIGIISATWFGFIFTYTSEDRPSQYFYLALIGTVLLSILVIFTNGTHQLMFTRVILSDETRFTNPIMQFGIGMFVFGLYAFGMVIIAIIRLVQELLHARQKYRYQIFAMLTVTIVPPIAIMIHLLGWQPYPFFSAIPFGVILSSLIHTVNIHNYQLGTVVSASHQAVITGLSEGLIILDADNKILDINPAAQIILNLENHSVVGEPLEKLWPDWQSLFARFQTGREKNFEIAFGTGIRTRTFDIRISNAFDNHGNFACRIIVLSDISDLKRAQTALQKAHDELELRVVERTAELALAESRYRSVMEQSVDVIFLVDLESLTLLEVNSAFQKLLGYPPEDISSLTLQDFIAHDAEELDPIITQVVEERQVLLEEGLFRHKDGTTIDVEVGASLISYGDREAVCVVARDIRTRKEAERNLENHAHKQAIIAELGQQALAGEDFSALLDTVNKHIADTLAVDLIGIYELITQKDEIYLRAGLGWESGLSGVVSFPMEAAENELRFTIDQQKPVYIEDVAVEDRCRPNQILLDHGVKTILNIPILGQDRPYGVLGVYSRRVQSYSPDDIFFLQTIANVLASTMAFQQSKAAIETRNREILTLQTAGTAITSSLDLKDVLRTVARETAQWLGVAGCAISEWDTDRDILRTMMDYGPDGWLTEEIEVGMEGGLEFDLEDYPLSKLVLTDRTPRQMSLDDPDIDPAEKALMEESDISTLLMLPMIYQDKVIGLVEVMDDWTYRTFSEQEIAMGQLLANQAASAIENARLFEETQQRLSEQTALREAISTISSALDLETVLSRIVEQMALTIDSTSAYVCIVDPKSRKSTVLAEYISENACEAEKVSDLGEEYDEYHHEWLSLLEAGEISTSHLDDPELMEREREEMMAFGGKSILYVPLHYQDNLLGFVEIWESRRMRDFTSQEIALCKDLASNAAIAINNARLFKETQKRLIEQTALREAVTAISSALELETVLSQIVKQMALTIDATSAYTCVIDKQTGASIVLAEFVGEEACEVEKDSDLGTIYVEDDPDFIDLMESGIIDTSHVDDPELDELERQHMLQYGAKSILYIPLKYQDELLGFVEIWESRQLREFSPEEKDLCLDLARHAALAINNARLYRQAQEEIHERKLAEQTLENYARELERSNEELEQFAYVASHDLQEPLRMVTSYVQLLDRRYRDQLDEDATEFIHYAAEGAHRMQQLIHDLLNYSRIGSQRESLTTIDTAQTVHAALKNLQVAIQESKAKITCDSLPSIQADGGQMVQLFQNLIGNAIKFRCEKPPQIHISAERANGSWKFAVADNGIGMNPEHKDKIFLIFQRLHTPEKYPGTGVGLAICKRIVERHNGRIWAESEMGKGSTFFFTINTGETS